MRCLVGLVLFFGFASVGAAQGTRGAYAGGGLGMTSFDGRDAAFSNEGNAFRILAGYRLNDRYGVEAGWGTTADIAHTFSIFSVRGLAIKPLSRIGVYGGAGYYEATFGTSATFGGAVLPGSRLESTREDSGATVIGGVMLDLQRISVRGEYEWLDTNSVLEASSVNLLVLLRF